MNALETYLQRKPDDSNAEQIRRRIENLKAQIAASAAPATPAPAAPPPPPVAPTPSATASTEASTPSSSNRQIVGPLLVGGGGLVLALIGGAVYSGGSKKISDAEDACPNRMCKPSDTTSQDLGNQGVSQQRAGGALIGIGLAAVAGGVVWYLVSGNSDGARAGAPLSRAMLIPAYAPGFAGVAVAGGF